MDSLKTDGLTEFITKLRKLGVLSFAGTVEGLGAVNLTLFPELPEITQPTEQKNSKPEKRQKGADGLDAEMQQTLYGRVLDAEG